MGAVLSATNARRGIMVSRSYRRLNRYSNSARYRGTCFSRTARYVPTRAALILPNAVLTHLKAGVRTACLPLPVFIEVCRHPAWVTAAKHARPSETTLARRSGCVEVRSARPLAAASHRDCHQFERAPHWSALAHGEYRHDDAGRPVDLSCLRRLGCF